MAATALKQITTEAKKIFKRGGTWKGAIKKASVKYRKHHKKKIGKVVRMTPAKRKRTVKRIRKLHKKEGKAIRALGSVESATAAALRSALVKKTKEQLAWALLARDQSKTKRGKREISKKISALKRYIRVYE